MGATKVKGFFKGSIEHVKDIFVVTKEEEHEMQIGLPTDVKHVAHIGIDGDSSVPQEKPSWMDEFHGDAKSTEQSSHEKKERVKGRSRPSPLRNSSEGEIAQSESQKHPKKKRRKRRDSSGTKPSKTKGKTSRDGDT